ncbi:MAG: hypothetical protein ACRD2L_24450, partial [Terriglobia bacterium]
RPFSAVVQKTSLSCLSVVGAGNTMDGSLPQVLEGVRWAEFLQAAREEFDVVIVDSLPAAAPVADFELLQAPCEALLLVVRMRSTTREGLMRAVQRVDRKKLIGVVVNDADAVKYHNNSYYYYGGGKR